MGLAPTSLVNPCLFFSFLFFFSLTLFFRLIPWSIEALCVHLSAWVSKTWTGRRSASSLPRETGRAPVASVNRASSLSQGFIGFLCKPRNIGLFLPSIPLSFIYSFIRQRRFSFGSPGSCGYWTPASINLRCLVYFNSKLLMFWQPSFLFLCKNFYISGSSHTEHSLIAIWEAVSRA